MSVGVLLGRDAGNFSMVQLSEVLISLLESDSHRLCVSDSGKMANLFWTIDIQEMGTSVLENLFILRAPENTGMVATL